MIIKLIKNPNSNSIEASWIEEEIKTISIIVEKEIDDEIQRVRENKDITVENIVHCQSFSDTQIELLRQTAKEFNTTFTKEQEKIIADVIANIKQLTEEELEAIELNRIQNIKATAKEKIESKYPSYKQRNIIMSQNQDDIKNMNDFISKIRQISNEAEISGTDLKDIDWGI